VERAAAARKECDPPVVAHWLWPITSQKYNYGRAA
jgi:hypothetical protein